MFFFHLSAPPFLKYDFYLCQCYLFCPLLCLATLLFPPSPNPGSGETWCLLRHCWSCLVDQPTGRDLSQRWAQDACLSDCQPCQPVRLGVCVRVCANAHMGCCHHRQMSCCDMSPRFVTLEDKNVSLGPCLFKYSFQVWISMFWYSWRCKFFSFGIPVIV